VPGPLVKGSRGRLRESAIEILDLKKKRRRNKKKKKKDKIMHASRANDRV